MNGTEHKTILVIEDDEDLRKVFKQALEAEGYTVRTAANGIEAIRFLESGKCPSLILLDLLMPLMNGTQFVSVLKNEQADILSSVPIILVSAASEPANELAKKLTGHLKKPFGLDLLLSTVNQHCSESNLH